MAIDIRYIINTSKIVYDTLDGEVIIINFDTGNYYSLNKTGKHIWNMLESVPFGSLIIKEITKVYSGDADNISTEITQFLKALQQEELLQVVEEERNGIDPRSIEKHEPNNGPEIPLFEKPGFQKYTDMKEMLLLDPIHEVDETGWPSSKMPGKKNQKNTL